VRPYGLISDTHNHGWSAFATTLPSGVNSRLQCILDEFERCARTVAEQGGNKIYHAGDMFHVRGSIAPSVINPTKDKLAEIHSAYGVSFVVMAGNHDLEGKNSERLGNAVEALGCDHVAVLSNGLLSPEVTLIPWHEKIADLKAVIERCRRELGANLANADLLLHAPLNGVINGIPPHGLDSDYLAGLGFNRVFAGHYHNAKDFGNGVYSIGALTHHTWSDVGTRAGFWIVGEEGQTWHASHAPQFIEIDHSMSKTDIELAVPGNYVRCKMHSPKDSQVKEMREWLESIGAKGVRVDIEREPTRVRTAGATVKAGDSIEKSIGDFIQSKGYAASELIVAESIKVLAEAA
jgi:DNA repair exonuclease SbcCD nuclease subunit